MSIKLMTRVWDETRFRGAELLVLLCLADHATDEGICWPSYDRLAARARISRRHAIRCVQTLEAEGWLTKLNPKPVAPGRFVNLYRIGPIGDTKSPVIAEKPQTSDISDTAGDIWDDTPVTPMSPESSVEPPIEPPFAQAVAFAWSDSVSLEDAYDHAMTLTDGNPALAVSLSSRWLKTPPSGQDWRESLSAFIGGKSP